MSYVLMLQMNNITRCEDFECSFLDSTVRVTVTILYNYSTALDFTLFGMPYTFNVPTWQSRGLARFLVLFHAHTKRDAHEFGVVTENEEGVPNIQMNVMQKTSAVFQACKDIMFCLDKIARKHRRSVLDYAVWFREMRLDESTYSQYITRRTCHSVVHSDFIAPDVKWEEVRAFD